ncbi:MAG: hypothetical protein ACXAC8_19915, partial [Candidatus Hodarchaeales archaeon]
FNFSYDPQAVSVRTHVINITFSLIHFESSSILVIFEVVKSPFVALNGTDALNGTVLTNMSSLYTRSYSLNEYDSFSISMSYYSNKTSQIFNVTTGEVTVVVNTTIWYSQTKESNLNWTFVFNGSAMGTFLINITFTHTNYTSLTFQIVYQINPAQTTVTEYDTSKLDNPTPGINSSVKSANSIVFWLIWRSEYGESINDTDGVISNDTSLLVFLNSTELIGIHYHYFRYTAIDTGVDVINLTFGTINYTSMNIILYFEVLDRSLVIDNIHSTHESDFISVVGFLQYGDIYYFNIVTNDSETWNPVNVSSFNTLPENVSFEGIVENGSHRFSYEAWAIATSSPVQLSIQFSKANYLSVSYLISFYIEYADSEIISTPNSITTYFTQDQNFSVIWQSISNSQITTSPVLRINSSTVTTSEYWLILLNSDNGKYNFTIKSEIVGNFSVSLFFRSTVFENQTYNFLITILPVPTLLGPGTNPTNDTFIGDLIPFYYSETYELRIHWLESFNNGSIIDSTINVSGNGKDFLTTAVWYSNGIHKFNLTAEKLGIFQISFILETTNFTRLTYFVKFNVSIMPTKSLTSANIAFEDQSVLVEDVVRINGSGYQTFREQNISNYTVILLMNETQVLESLFDFKVEQNRFSINFTTRTYHYGNYSLTLGILKTGYQNQHINFSITLLGRETIFSVTFPSKTFEQGEPIEITALLNYTQTTGGGSGAGILLTPLNGTDVSFYIGLEYSNGTIRDLPVYTTQTDVLGKATYTIDGKFTQDAKGFSKIDVESGPSLSGLPSIYSMSAAELAEYEIIYIFDPLEIIIPVIITGVVILLIVGSLVGSSVVLNRKRKHRSQLIQLADSTIEKGFEDIKSIRLILAKHESGLPFYVEKTIADFQADTDTLSGMSTAISQFIEDVSGQMQVRNENGTLKKKFETISREGFHMLSWNGNYSSLVIISEIELPDYYKERLEGLGNELEFTFQDDLKNFYDAEKLRESVIRKIVRKYISLHYFSAYVLNEGVLTLKNIKLSRNEKKMISQIKKLIVEKQGIQYFFSEQIISYLAMKYKRSKVITFLEKMISLNYLVECSQEELLKLSE